MLIDYVQHGWFQGVMSDGTVIDYRGGSVENPIENHTFYEINEGGLRKVQSLMTDSDEDGIKEILKLLRAGELLEENFKASDYPDVFKICYMEEDASFTAFENQGEGWEKWLSVEAANLPNIEFIPLFTTEGDN